MHGDNAMSRGDETWDETWAERRVEFSQSSFALVALTILTAFSEFYRVSSCCQPRVVSSIMAIGRINSFPAFVSLILKHIVVHMYIYTVNRYGQQQGTDPVLH